MLCRNGVVVCHNRGIDVLKMGCTLPNLANNCLYSFIGANLYLLIERDKLLPLKVRKDIVGGPSILFTRKSVVDETHIRKSTYVCQTIFGIDAGRFYHYSSRWATLTEFYIRYGFDAYLPWLKPRQKKSRSFGNTVMSLIQRKRSYSRFESCYRPGTQKKIDCFNANGCCGNYHTLFEAMGCFYWYCVCQEARPALTEEHIQRRTKIGWNAEKVYREEKLHC